MIHYRILLNSSDKEQGKHHQDVGLGIFFSLASLKPMHCYNCIITYDIIHSNSHPAAIDPSQGIFTAPEGGNYFFQFHGLVKEHKQAKVQVIFAVFYYSYNSVKSSELDSILSSILLHFLLVSYQQCTKTLHV